MVNCFEIIGFPLDININAFWGVGSCIMINYMKFAGEYVIWTACNSVMYFYVSTFSLFFKVGSSNSLKVRCKWIKM